MDTIPFEYSATCTSIARAATRFRESERADLGSMSALVHDTSRSRPRLFRVHVTVRQVWLRGALFSLVRFPLHHPVAPS